MTRPTHYVFDAYGTLFDVSSAAARYANEIGPNWDRLSQIWRQKHLEYSWIHSQTGRMTSFWTLTERSLDFAIATVGGVPPGLREKLLGAYRTLSAYPEVPDVLRRLKDSGATTAILSNGDPDMLDDAIASAGIGNLLDAAISVQDAGIFKPSAKVYELVGKRFGAPPSAVSFQSSNRWDAAAANVFGFRVVWINRSGQPPEYPDMPPDHVLRSLDTLPDLAWS